MIQIGQVLGGVMEATFHYLDGNCKRGERFNAKVKCNSRFKTPNWRLLYLRILITTSVLRRIAYNRGRGAPFEELKTNISWIIVDNISRSTSSIVSRIYHNIGKVPEMLMRSQKFQIRPSFVSSIVILALPSSRCWLKRRLVRLICQRPCTCSRISLPNLSSFRIPRGRALRVCPTARRGPWSACPRRNCGKPSHD